MQANPINFKFMYTSKNEDLDFECKNVTIEHKESVKLLGININNMLSLPNMLAISFGNVASS